MGSLLRFSNTHMYMIAESIDLAEDLVTDYFNISPDEWRNYRYDVKTLAHLGKEEIADNAFAQICKYQCIKEEDSVPPLSFDLYRICLQDHRILSAVRRSVKRIKLKPLILYIVTHELSHVVRFNKYCKDFYASRQEKEFEEANVHSLTYEMLRSIGDQDLDRVLGHYRRYRWNLLI